MKYFLVASFVFGVVLVSVARPQIETGTVVVFGSTQEEFTIAADSRGTFLNKPPEDCYCKIAAFKFHRVIFATTGASLYPNGGIGDSVPSWDAISEAAHAIAFNSKHMPTAKRYIDIVASRWANRMLHIWSTMYAAHREGVKQIAARNKGLLITGIFATVRGNVIAHTIRGIRLQDGRLTVEPSACSVGNICASGETDTYSKYSQIGLPPLWDKSGDIGILTVIEFVDLTIAEDKSGTVGGKVDVLTLRRNGKMEWYKKKPNCPENSD